jgi:hypothetical protein
MVLVQVPASLADELCIHEDCHTVLGTRAGAMEVALVVLAAGSNLVNVIVAPKAIKESVETIRSWMRRCGPGAQVEVAGPSINGLIVIEATEDIDAAVAVIWIALGSGDMTDLVE